jgi:hypothetical protein
MLIDFCIRLQEVNKQQLMWVAQSKQVMHCMIHNSLIISFHHENFPSITPKELGYAW